MWGIQEKQEVAEGSEWGVKQEPKQSHIKRDRTSRDHSGKIIIILILTQAITSRVTVVKRGTMAKRRTRRNEAMSTLWKVCPSAHKNRFSTTTSKTSGTEGQVPLRSTFSVVLRNPAPWPTATPDSRNVFSASDSSRFSASRHLRSASSRARRRTSSVFSDSHRLQRSHWVQGRGSPSGRKWSQKWR
ncbi:hypothetical protein VTK73DRAFT_6518 [Phialemonium thermophilum]|uniref:Uncharacterized protein n=1 Tax=Phialemonium thermophilum TaxID=223376 RepID=A0ABR3V005_9PEZI